MKKILITTVLFVLLNGMSCLADNQTILVIESYSGLYPWDASYKKGLENILGKDYTLVYFEMNTKRLPPAQYEKRGQLAYEMYEQIQPVLVILGDDNALKFVGPRLAETKTPVVYLGVNNNPRDYGINKAENITGVLERPLMKRSIIYLSKWIHPKPQKILLLFDSGNTSKISVHEMFNDQSSVSMLGIQIDLKLIGQWSEWKKTVLSAKLKGYDAVVVGLYQTIVDDDGSHVDAEDVIAWTSKHTPLPPFGFWDFTVGPDKTIGGLVLFGKTHGELAAQMALKILGGKNPKQIAPVMENKGRFFFSRSQLEKWGITLPEKISSKADFIE